MKKEGSEVEKTVVKCVSHEVLAAATHRDH